MDDLAWLAATALARLIRTQQLSPLETVDAAIARIEALNPPLNAVITPLFETARRRVRAPDLPDGPFRAAGFIFLGKTNLPELALAPVTEPAACGLTRNPP